MKQRDRRERGFSNGRRSANLERGLCMFDSLVFKVLAHNDTGAAVGHQGGIVIPKALEEFFPDVSGTITALTPTADINLTADLIVGGRLAATVLTTEPSWNGDLVHVRFDAMTPAVADALSIFLAEHATRAERTVRRPGTPGTVIQFARR